MKSANIDFEIKFRSGVIADATVCPKEFQRLSALQDTLKSMPNIKPGVLQNVATISEKFVCNGYQVPEFLENFVSYIFSQIFACNSA